MGHLHLAIYSYKCAHLAWGTDENIGVIDCIQLNQLYSSPSCQNQEDDPAHYAANPAVCRIAMSTPVSSPSRINAGLAE